MDADYEIKQQVIDFYNQVGWQMVGEGVYQNARYEDLRPVARDYIHNCHLRVGRYIKPAGRFFLDAGSGPIQYPEYLTYSQGYDHRVCVDISIIALQEARKRVSTHGLFVVADIAHLPFKRGVFDGIVSLHTIHHLPAQDHINAYEELYRVLSQECSGVIVNGWGESSLMRRLAWLMRLGERLMWWSKKLSARSEDDAQVTPDVSQPKVKEKTPQGTFVAKRDVGWLKSELGRRMSFEIRVWRSVSVRFMRAVFHARLGGRLLLKLLFALEERYPHYFGEKGQYPLVVIYKSGLQSSN